MNAKRSHLIWFLGATLLLTGCGGPLTGRYTGSQTSGGYGGQYTTSWTLYQDGDKVFGQVKSVQNQSSQQQTSGGTSYSGGYSYSGAKIAGELEGTVDGDTVTNVTLKADSSVNPQCTETYTGNLTHNDGKIMGSLVLSSSACGSTGGSMGYTSVTTFDVTRKE